jgi:ATP-binding cassette subfamily B protein
MLLFDSIIIGKLLNQCGVGVDNFNGNYDDTKEGYWLGLSLEHR